MNVQSIGVVAEESLQGHFDAVIDVADVTPYLDVYEIRLEDPENGEQYLVTVRKAGEDD